MPRFNNKRWNVIAILVLFLLFPVFNIGSAIGTFFFGVPVIRSTSIVSGSSADVESGIYLTTDGCLAFPIVIADPDFYSNWTYRALARVFGPPSYGTQRGLSRSDIVNGIASAQLHATRFPPLSGKQRFECSRKVPHNWQCVANQEEWTSLRVLPNRNKSRVVYLYDGSQARMAIVVDSESEEAIQFMSLKF